MRDLILDAIQGREFELALRYCGLTAGQRGDKEHHQPCPFCGGKDRFYFRKDKKKFACRQCGYSIAKELNIAIVVVTHVKKGAKDEEGTSGVMGSKALPAIADVVMVLRRKWNKTDEKFSDDGKLYVTGRMVCERTIKLEHTENWLWYDEAGNGSHGMCPRCNGEGYYSFYENGAQTIRRCECQF